jgi:glycosyltransferase involved in cell wall biosynthesis
LSGKQPRENTRSEIVNLLFIGRIVESKGAQDLLLALAKCMDAGRRNFSLKIVGNLSFSDHKYIDELRSILKSNGELAKRVQLVGEVDDQEKWQSLRNADVFVLPTYHEGFCVPVVEALAAGCFVVSYNNSNVPNVTGDLGILVATGDIQALANAVTELCDEWTKGFHDDRELVIRSRTRTWTRSQFYRHAGIWAEQYSLVNRRSRYLDLIKRFLPA